MCASIGVLVLVQYYIRADIMSANRTKDGVISMPTFRQINRFGQ